MTGAQAGEEALAAVRRLERSARLALLVFLAMQGLTLHLALGNDALDAAGARWEVPAGVLVALHTLGVAAWVMAALRVLALAAGWAAHDWRPAAPARQGAAAAAVLLVLPFLTVSLARPQSAPRLTDTCVNRQRKLVQALLTEDLYYPTLGVDWLGEAKVPPAAATCPATVRRFHTRGGYALNARLVGVPLPAVSSPDRIPLLADGVRPGGLLRSARDVARTRHLRGSARGFVCSFVDGHQAFVAAGDPLPLGTP